MRVDGVIAVLDPSGRGGTLGMSAYTVGAGAGGIGSARMKRSFSRYWRRERETVS